MLKQVQHDGANVILNLFQDLTYYFTECSLVSASFYSSFILHPYLLIRLSPEKCRIVQAAFVSTVEGLDLAVRRHSRLMLLETESDRFIV
jgi:hypothetical protein